jgi:uncharacterized protein
MMYIDPLYLMIIGPALLLALWAQFKVKLAFSKYNRVGSSSRLTGGQVARYILDANGLREVAVEVTRGFLSDHYDPRKKILRLSPEVYNQPSIAAAGVAAHEVGHALQDSTGYFPLKFRNAIVPTAQIGSWLAFPMIFIGILLSLKGLALAGFVLFMVIVAFQIITLPVELNASRRAKKAVADLGLVRSEEEAKGVSAVLSAAAFTYVAATITALAQLLYFALRLGLIGGRRND